ncbi:MAG: hypothetical protein U0640_06785 [Phycisphaerales bacterium]
MTTATVQPAASTTQPKVPYAQLLLGFLGASLIGVGAGYVFNSSEAALQGALLGPLCLWLASMMGLSAYALAGPQLERIAFSILGSSLFRMILALSMGLVVYFIGLQDSRDARLTFWVAFLVAGLLALVIETALGLSLIKSLEAARPQTRAASSPSSIMEGSAA